jgi:glutathione S-transferase
MRLAHAWPELDAELAGRDWLVGEGITMADIDLLVCVEFSAWVKGSPPQECQNLHAHAERVKNALQAG